MEKAKTTVRIEVTGRDHSGKSTAVAAIAHALRGLGAEVIVQRAGDDLVEKLEFPDERLAKRLVDTRIIITELQTAL